MNIVFSPWIVRNVKNTSVLQGISYSRQCMPLCTVAAEIFKKGLIFKLNGPPYTQP